MHIELTKEETMSLISEYRSEIKKNLAKNEFFNAKIEELKATLEDGYHTEYQVITNNKPERNKEKQERKPYPLSKWDYIILDIIKANEKPTLSKEIYDKAMAKAVELGIAMDKGKMKSKINQCLVKLASRRNDIIKMRYGGKGLAYCLPENVK